MKMRINFKNRDRKQRYSLILMFSLLVFGILLVAVTLAAVFAWLLVRFDVIKSVSDSAKPSVFASLMVGISVVMGMVIAFFAIRLPLGPINKLINQINRMSDGEYDAKVNFSPAINRINSFKELSDSFNKLSDELKNTELLRSDFINNFSHEFKTPIVSILGFARLLKRGNLSEEQKAQYINAIEEESLRLSYMATNVLSLTRVENRRILTDVSKFNLSEQLRSSILLLEDKWVKKELELDIDIGEFEIEANEELLKEIWINLLDNAIKFADVGGRVSLKISETGETLEISIGNTGSEIPEDAADKIWRKFYQADESHASEGNGIGLAIVKRIVELHSGNISVNSENKFTEFTVELPKKGLSV